MYKLALLCSPSREKLNGQADMELAQALAGAEGRAGTRLWCQIRPATRMIPDAAAYFRKKRLQGARTR